MQRVLEGKVTIVTGGAVGMGAATAKLFAAEGASVLIADIDEEKAVNTASEIQRAGGVASWKRVDVSSAVDVKSMVDTACERYGRLDCAVKNAAAQDATPLVDMTEEDLDRMLTVNLKSVVLCLKYEIRRFFEQSSSGTIVNVASINAVRPQPN